MGKLRLKKCLALIGVGALATAAWVTYGYYLRQEARSLLDDVRALTLAPDHDAAFFVLRKKYGGRLKPLNSCSADWCSYQLSVSNHLGSALFRMPYTELTARFDLHGKSVVLVMVDYRSAQSSRESPVVHIQTDVCADCGWFFVNPWSQSSSPERWNGIVEMGVTTSTELRQAALALNTDCLTNLHGCADISQLLPSVWQNSAHDIRCLIANRSGQAK